jgi:YD repeat-containing protein
MEGRHQDWGFDRREFQEWLCSRFHLDGAAAVGDTGIVSSYSRDDEDAFYNYFAFLDEFRSSTHSQKRFTPWEAQHKDFIGVIKAIRERPAMYLGHATFRGCYSYLMGDERAQKDLSLPEDEGRSLFRNFQKWVQIQVYLTNQYDSSGRVSQQTEIDTGTYLFHWTASGNTAQFSFFGGSVVTNGSGMISTGCWNGSSVNRYSAACSQGYEPLISQVDVTDPRGYVREVKFGSNGYVSSETHALGQPEQQSVTYQYYADNTVQSVTDALGRVTGFDYDNLGNMTTVTQLSGTSNAVTTTATYNGPFSQIDSITDPLGHSSTFSYDSLGRMTAATDPLGHQTTFNQNGSGQLVSVTDALNNTVQYSYLGGDLVTVTDPLGNVSSSLTDAVGRVTSSTDALGNTSQYQYNNYNLVTQATDAQGNLTKFAYDPNGNLQTLTDANTHPTNYTYDNMDRVQTRTDPVLRGPENYTYDLNGNLASATDRKGQ